MRRFLRAFALALWLTLRGKSPSPARFRPLERWIADGLHLLKRVMDEAAAEGMGGARRETLRLKLDGRPTSLESALGMARHNLDFEYPRLLRLDDPHALTVLQSSNLNDQYRIARFAESDLIESPALKRSLSDLAAHLANMPATDEDSA